jgi:HAD superfamily hydrolase (TIGR01509 family)
MMPPNTVVFDLGKVLLDFDYGRAIERIRKRCRLTSAELHSLLNQSALLHRYESNQLSTAQFFAEVQQASDFQGSLAEFRELFADIFTPIRPMLEMQRQLRERSVPTYLFSNTNDIEIGHIRDRFPFFANFDGYILSFEHNAMKPDPEIYRVVERTSGRSGSELLYIDDRPENIATGEALGWRTILHHEPARTVEAVRAFGLLADAPA